LERLLAGHDTIKQMSPYLVQAVPEALLVKLITGLTPLSAVMFLPCFAFNVPANNFEGATKVSTFSS
jgi:hypothetical protein